MRSLCAFDLDSGKMDGSLQVIAGHGRVLAAKLAGMTELPTISLEHLTETQANARQSVDREFPLRGVLRLWLCQMA